MPCNSCKFFKPRSEIKQTALERYEADTRPEAETFMDKLRWFNNPSAFRDPPPDSIDTMFDDLELYRRQVGFGTCQRFPDAVTQYGNYHCGEYENVL